MSKLDSLNAALAVLEAKDVRDDLWAIRVLHRLGALTDTEAAEWRRQVLANHRIQKRSLNPQGAARPRETARSPEPET